MNPAEETTLKDIITEIESEIAYLEMELSDSRCSGERKITIANILNRRENFLRQLKDKEYKKQTEREYIGFGQSK